MRTDHLSSVTRQELDAALRALIGREFGDRQVLSAWRRRVSAYSSSCIITQIRLELSGAAAPVLLGFKNLTPGSQLPTARRVRPEFLYDPEREIRTYESLLGRLDLGTARFHGSDVDPQRPRFWLFLEWVRGPLLWQLGRIAHWQQAARWLATLHHQAVRLKGRQGLLEAVRPVQYDAEIYANWMARAETVLRETLLRDDESSARQFARIVRRYDRVINYLTKLPRTLVHGEFFPANVLMRWTGREHRVCPIDWELTGWGPGHLDLAALTVGGWSEPERQKILGAYHSASKEYGSTEATLSELRRAVDHCRLHLCIRHLGWANRWRPAGQDRRKWLTDAFATADELGL